MILDDLVDPSLVGGYRYVAVHRDGAGKPYKYAAQVPSSLSKTRKQFQIMPMVDTAQAAAQQVVDYVNTPLTIEDIRNPARKSGFDHVAYRHGGEVPTGHAGGPNANLYQAQSGPRKVKGDSWYGPRRATPGEAAQDYIDYINAQNLQQAPRLKSAGHAYNIEKTDRDPEVEAALGVLRDARAQREGKDGFVYLISDGEYVKIGYSVNPNKRVAELQTGNGRPLRLLAMNSGTESDEKNLHQKYIEDNVLMEWFTVSEELLSEFDVGSD